MVQFGELDFSKSGQNMFIQNPLIGYLRVMRQVDRASRKVFLGILCNCEFVWFRGGGADKKLDSQRKEFIRDVHKRAGSVCFGRV